jgi:two-component system, NtrC family, nitrogen regulation response regulator NtrX
VDVRIIAATNKNLKEEINKGRFREDLYHRISVIVIEVLPLRERKDDIPLLVNHFVDKICGMQGKPKPVFTEKALAELQTYKWTGNIRELHNATERLVILGGSTIEKEDVVRFAKPLN